jgi:hypothetical protein
LKAEILLKVDRFILRNRRLPPFSSAETASGPARSAAASTAFESWSTAILASPTVLSVAAIPNNSFDGAEILIRDRSRFKRRPFHDVPESLDSY